MTAAEDAGKVAAQDQAAAAAAEGKPAPAKAATQRPSANSATPVEAAPPVIDAEPCAECARNSDRLAMLEQRVEQMGKIVGGALLVGVLWWLVSGYRREQAEAAARAEVEA